MLSRINFFRRQPNQHYVPLSLNSIEASVPSLYRAHVKRLEAIRDCINVILAQQNPCYPIGSRWQLVGIDVVMFLLSAGAAYATDFLWELRNQTNENELNDLNQGDCAGSKPISYVCDDVSNRENVTDTCMQSLDLACDDSHWYSVVTGGIALILFFLIKKLRDCSREEYTYLNADNFFSAKDKLFLRENDFSIHGDLNKLKSLINRRLEILSIGETGLNPEVLKIINEYLPETDDVKESNKEAREVVRFLR